MKANEGRSSTVFVLVVVLVMALSSSLGISSLNQVEEFIGVKVGFEEGLEIIKSQSHEISTHVKWNEIRAAGIKVTETSLKGFLQICERLALNFGRLRIYVDLEARVTWVFSDPPNEEADTEVYYVQFT